MFTECAMSHNTESLYLCWSRASVPVSDSCQFMLSAPPSEWLYKLKDRQGAFPSSLASHVSVALLNFSK